MQTAGWSVHNCSQLSLMYLPVITTAQVAGLLSLGRRERQSILYKKDCYQDGLQTSNLDKQHLSAIKYLSVKPPVLHTGSHKSATIAPLFKYSTPIKSSLKFNIPINQALCLALDLIGLHKKSSAPVNLLNDGMS